MDELKPRSACRTAEARLQGGNPDVCANLLAEGRARRPAVRARGRAAAAVLAIVAALAGASIPALAARPRVYAITDARIVLAPGRVVEKGTVVLRDGTIVDVGEKVRAPEDAELVDGRGMTVYAGLIDPFTHLGMPPREAGGAASRSGDRPKPSEKPAERGPGRPNVQVRSDVKGALLYQAPSREELEKLHAAGFTSALVVPDGGALRGTSALVHLAGDDPARAIVAADVAAHLSFETAEENVYPNSLMGVIALIRQTFEDARRQALWEERWRKDPKGLERPPVAPALDAAEEILKGKRVFFEADDTHAFGGLFPWPASSRCVRPWSATDSSTRSSRTSRRRACP